MFIPRLYTHSKLAAICLVMFIALFIYINYKWGVVASPIYQLGMFSKVAHKTDTQNVYTLYSDDKPIVLNDLPFIYNDMILVLLSRYETHTSHNREVLDVFNKYAIRILHKPLPADIYTINITEHQASLWFSKLLQSYDIPVRNLSVYSRNYTWENGHLKESPGEVKKIIATNL